MRTIYDREEEVFHSYQVSGMLSYSREVMGSDSRLDLNY